LWGTGRRCLILGRKDRQLADYKAEESILRRALTVIERENGREGADYVTGLETVARACLYQTKLAEAEQLYEQAQRLRVNLPTANLGDDVTIWRA
jgi:hypothetical protein